MGTTVPSSKAICLLIITTRSSRSPPWFTSARGIMPYPNSSSMGSTCSRLFTFSGWRISSAAASSVSTMVSVAVVSRLAAMPRPPTTNNSPIPTNNMVFKSVAKPRTDRVAPTKYITLGIPKSCLIITGPNSASLPPLVTRIPVDREISREGIWLTRPSPMVRMP